MCRTASKLFLLWTFYSFIFTYVSPRTRYRKIPKVSPQAYIFQRPFLRGLFLDVLIFGGAYLQREICVSKQIGRAQPYSWKEIYHFCFVLLVFEGNFLSTSPRGAYIQRGDLTEGFLRQEFRGLIFGEAYTWRGLFLEFYSIFGARDELARILHHTSSS